MINNGMSMFSRRQLALLNYLYLLLVMFVIAGILTMAMTLQYANGELPCPLCLLERVAMLGVCFGIMLNFRRGFSYQNTGFSLLSAILLLIISVRQSLLDIYPRPGHEYIGSAISAFTCRCGQSSLRCACSLRIRSSLRSSVAMNTWAKQALASFR